MSLFEHLCQDWEKWQALDDIPEDLREAVAEQFDEWKDRCRLAAVDFPEESVKQFGFARACEILAALIRR